ncbi:MAG: GGDEF domain-containing protein [Candidatus Rokubacteria bacterium]|nr:GGDEF domain-containing protein [Candidatus Rokubacteria bacterium]
MPTPRPRRVPFSRYRIKRKVILAVLLSSIIPLMILTYVLLDPESHAAQVTALQALIVFTALLMAGGLYVIWDVATAVARAAEAAASARPLEEFEGRLDEVGTLASSFGHMLSTINQQTSEINAFGARLDSARRELEVSDAPLKNLLFKDEVTGLYNRRFLMFRLEEELSRYRRFNHPASVVLADLDGFKEINDTLGHAVGDETLREVGQLLVTHSRGMNVIARYGGDEFAILLVETPKSGARLYAERMRQLIAGCSFGHGRRLTASFGIASLPEDVSASADDLIRAADEALYAAKRTGKNVVAGYEPGAVELETKDKVD